MQVDWGSLRSLEPVSRQFGYDRGTPVDRYYIERFLESNSSCISGRVLEVGDDSYTRRFGGSRVTRADVFHVHAGNPRATFVGDLASADTIPSGVFDCAIITQTLPFIWDTVAGLRTLHRILRPGGVLLLTTPGLTTLSSEADEWSQMWYWSFTPASFRALVEQAFRPELVRFETHGNVLAGLCALQGIALEDVTTAELDSADPDSPILLAVRAEKERG